MNFYMGSIKSYSIINLSPTNNSYTLIVTKCTYVNSNMEHNLETFIENQEQTNVDESLSSIKFIPRKYIPKGTISLEHAQQCIFPGEVISPSEKRENLLKLKNECKEWFRNELAKMMVAEIQEKQLSLKVIRNDNTKLVPVRNFEDFLEKVEQDCSHGMMKTIFRVSHGYFDLLNDWQINLEEKYMKEYQFQYSESSYTPHKSKGKGCFEIICAGEKTELVKRIQHAGKRTHGKYITLELPRNNNGGYTKRKLGIFYPEFVKCVERKEGKETTKSRRYRDVRIIFIISIVMLLLLYIHPYIFHSSDFKSSTTGSR